MSKKQKMGVVIGAFATLLIVIGAVVVLNWGTIQALQRQQQLQGYWLRDYSKKNLAQILHFDGKTGQVISTADDLKQTKKLYINSTYEKVGDKVDGKIKWATVKHSKNSDELAITGWTYTKISKAKAQVYLDAVEKAREDAQTYSYGNNSSLDLGQYEVGKDLKAGGVKLYFDYADDDYDSDDNGIGEILVDGQKKATVKSGNESPRIILKKGQILELQSSGINSSFMLNYE